MILAIFGITWAAFVNWAFWTTAAVALSYAVGLLLAKDPDRPAPIDPDQLNIPTTRQGTKFTINFGTNWIENPVVAWWGDVSIVPRQESYSERSGFSSHRVYYTVAYAYYVGMDLILTQGQNDGIIQIKADEIVIWPNPDDVTQYQADGATSAVMNEPDILGGWKSGGGIVGTISFQYGDSSQTPNAYLVGELGSNISASRGLTRAIFQHVWVGESPYPPKWKFLVKRTTILTDGSAQWNASRATINTYDMNPAHMIRECYTNTDWGYGYDSTDLDSTSWEDGADTLYNEGFGLSMKWESPNQTLGDFINDILRHINAVVYQSPTTGQIVFKLIRDDYPTPTQYDDSDILEVDDLTAGALHEMPNYVELTYWDRQNNRPIFISEYNLATMLMQNSKIVPYEVKFQGIQNDTLARTISARERYQISVFPHKMTVKTKRTMSHLLPGDVFDLVWPPLNIVTMYLRVMSVNHGTLHDPVVTLTCIQDVFAAQNAVFSEALDTTWTRPTNAPTDAPSELLMEVPFWDVYRSTTLAEVLALDAGTGYLLIAASKPSNDALDYELNLRTSPSGSFLFDGRGFFTPNGLIPSDMAENAEDATITLTNPEDLVNVTAGDYAVIEDEILKVKSVDSSTGQVTLARGCLDTVPAEHAIVTAGAPTVWFAGSVSYISGQEFSATDQPGVKILPRTAQGQLADTTAVNSDAMNSRIDRPYPPGDFQINSESYPEVFFGQPTISWAHRDRQQQLDTITEHSDASVGPEAGTTYTLQIYNENNSLIHTESGLTGTSYTYSEADERSDDVGTGGDLNYQLRFVLKSVRGGYDSWQSYDVTVRRATSIAGQSDIAITVANADLSVTRGIAGQSDVTITPVGDLTVTP